MRVDVSYKYGKGSKGVIFFLMSIWCLALLIAMVVIKFSNVINIPSSSSPSGFGPDQAFNVIFIVFPIMFGIIGFIFFIFGLKRVWGAPTARRIENNGKEAIGIISELSRKVVSYQGRIVTNIIIFYYKFKDGRVGQTTQSISNRAYKVLSNHHHREVPIKVLGDRAVVDHRRILQ